MRGRRSSEPGEVSSKDGRGGSLDGKIRESKCGKGRGMDEESNEEGGDGIERGRGKRQGDGI